LLGVFFFSSYDGILFGDGSSEQGVDAGKGLGANFPLGGRRGGYGPAWPPKDVFEGHLRIYFGHAQWRVAIFSAMVSLDIYGIL
jgi:hypothetical protein